MSSRKHFRSGLAALLASAPPSTAAASDLIGPIGLSMGSAVAADPATNDAIAASPAVLGLRPRYDFAAAAGLSQRGYELSASALDARQTSFTLGFAYRRATANPDLTDADMPGWVVEGEEISNRKSSHEMALGLSFPFAERRFALGLSGAGFRADDDRYERRTTGDLTAGLAWAPAKWATLTATAQNLVWTDTQPELPLRAVVGLRFDDETLGAFAAEGHWQAEGADGVREALGIRAGFSKILGSSSIQGGWRLQGGTHHLSLGLGLSNPTGRFDAAVEIPLSDLECHEVVFRIGILGHLPEDL